MQYSDDCETILTIHMFNSVILYLVNGYRQYQHHVYNVYHNVGCSDNFLLNNVNTLT